MSFAEQVVRELGVFFEPIEDAVASAAGLKQLLSQFGYDVVEADAQAALGGLGTLNDGLTKLTQALGAPDHEEGEPPPPPPQQLGTDDLVRLGDAARQIFTGLRALPQSLPTAVSPQTLFEELWDYLAATYVFERAPTLFRVLVLLGVFELETLIPGLHAEARAASYLRRRVHWDRAGRFLKDPAGLMGEVYGWGTAGFAASTLLTRLSDALEEFGLATRIRNLDPALKARFLPDAGPLASAIGVDLPLLQEFVAEEDDHVELGLLGMPVQGQSDADTGLGLMPYATGAVSPTRSLSEDGSLKIASQLTGSIAGAAVFTLRPSGPSVETGLSAIAANASISVDVSKTPVPPATSLILIGEESATRLDATSAVISVGADVTTAGDGELFVAAGVSALKLVVEPGEDGLLSVLLNGPFTIDAGDVVLGWRPGRGIYFERSAGLSVLLPINVSVASVLRLREIRVSVLIDSPPAFEVDVSGDATIGPLRLGVERLGVKLRIVEDPDGILGKYGIDAGLKAPTGYLASLDAGPVRGGGALSVQDHEYRGALALKFETFGFAAFAILTTRLPGGRTGFSFVAAIFGDFVVPLGYGFFLTGLGGLIGINRTSNTDALRQVLYEGQLDSILFPADPIANAPTILDNIAAIFPAEEGQYVFGPIARVAFSQPALIEGKLGIVLELGAHFRLLILGALGSHLPTSDAPLVVLEVTFFGDVDFGAGKISFDATLQNSRILAWAVSGDMAARTGWAPHLDHVISFGGLHPSYPRPANLPDLRRMSMNFGTNDPRVSLWSYQAVTLNSLQFGAGGDLYAKGPEIPFVGRVAAEGHAYFDALIYFNPFAFDAALGGSLSLLVDGDVAAGLGFDLRLTGPNEFVIDGKVWVTVCGIDVDFHIHHRWGDLRDLPAAVADAIALLRDALGAAPELEPIAAAALADGVRFRAARAGEEGPRGTSPVGGLRFSQRALPLGIAIEKIGEAQIVGTARTFDLAVFANQQSVDVAGAELDFVRGHFWKASEAERLRAPTFERHRSGFEVASGDKLLVNINRAIDVEYGYEFIEIGNESVAGASPTLPFAVLATPAVSLWMDAHHRANTAPLDRVALVRAAADAPEVKSQRYAVVDDPGLAPRAFYAAQETQSGNVRRNRNPVVSDYLMARGG